MLKLDKDRNKKPQTNIKKIIINRKMGWCDDSAHKKYNKLIKIEKILNMKKCLEKMKNMIY